MRPTYLDDVNLRILGHLAKEARIPYTTMAKNLRLSPNTVRDRIVALERRGVIRGYRAVINDARVGATRRALVLLECRSATLDANLLNSIPGVCSAYRSPGRHNVILEMVGPDMGAIQATLRQHLYPHGFKTGKLIPLENYGGQAGEWKASQTLLSQITTSHGRATTPIREAP